MKFTFTLQIGERSILIEDEAATPHELWKKMDFWDSLPTAGPGGEADLYFSHRTPQGFEFFAIECRSAGQEFKFGQKKDDKGLFPKGWEAIQHGRDDHEEEPEPARRPAPSAAPPAPVKQATPPMRPTRADGWTAKHAALDGIIRELITYRDADAVKEQIMKWTRGREIEQLSEDEASSVMQNANGWLIATKKAGSRMEAA